MNVRELIECLTDEDPEAEVLIEDAPDFREVTNVLAPFPGSESRIGTAVVLNMGEAAEEQA